MASEKAQTSAKEEKIVVTLPLTADKTDDVTVIINGFVTKIQRGVEVEVSPAVYEVLKHSEKMDMEALMRSRKLANGI